MEQSVDLKKPSSARADDLTGEVVKELARGRVIVDLGLEHGVRVGDVFAVFRPGDELVHPRTGASLGVVEQVKAHLVAEHVQPHMSQLGPVGEARADAGGSGQVLSAVLARTSAPPREVGHDRRRRPEVGDGVRRLV